MRVKTVVKWARCVIMKEHVALVMYGRGMKHERYATEVRSVFTVSTENGKRDQYFELNLQVMAASILVGRLS